MGPAHPDAASAGVVGGRGPVAGGHGRLPGVGALPARVELAGAAAVPAGGGAGGAVLAGVPQVDPSPPAAAADALAVAPVAGLVDARRAAGLRRHPGVRLARPLPPAADEPDDPRRHLRGLDRAGAA